MSSDHDRVFALIVAACNAAPGASLRQVAARLRVHRHTVSGILLEETGFTWRAWRRREVATHARDMLIQQPGLSVKEVAAGVDLTTNGLRRLLLREFGLTPTEIRRGRRRR
jgi:AraC-like DNA-binding protein